MECFEKCVDLAYNFSLYNSVLPKITHHFYLILLTKSFLRI